MKTDNELIAEFMGFDCNRSIPGHGGTVIVTLTEKDCRYHTSWDWLMPVVEKISSMYYPKGLEDNPLYHVEFAHALLSLPIDSSIQEVYNEVVRSIKWYKEKQP